MIVKMYAVHDSGVAAFGPPFFAQNEVMMLRSLQELVQSEMQKAPSQRVEFMKYPSSFAVFEVGRFDTESGGVEAVLPIVRVCGMSDLVKEEI